MGLGLAIKAFLKAWKEPEKGEQFVQDLLPKQIESSDASHLRLLFLLQQGSRLIDFLKEDITPFSDAQVGSAVRKIHQDCGQILEELLSIRPLRDEAEGSVVQVPKGYNPAEVKVVGKIKGEPPFKGQLVHRGWKVQKRSLPKKTGEQMSEVIFPAEIEIKS